MENRIFTANRETDDDALVRAATVGISGYDAEEAEVEKSLDELARLLDTAGAEVIFRLVPNFGTVD